MNIMTSALTLIVLIAVASITGFLILVHVSIQTDNTFNGSSEKSVETDILCDKTGRIFSPGPVGFAVSAGYRAPGEKIGAYLYLYKPDDYFFNGTYVVRIYGFNDNGGSIVLSRNISAHGLPVNIRWRIPVEGYYHKYVVLVLAVENNSVIDCIKGYVIVPEQEVKAKLVLDKDIYRVGETVEFKIVNLGDTPISFGRPYQVYYLNNSEWVLADKLTPDVWTMELIVLEKNHSFTQQISLENAVPGKYKIVKIVHGEGTNITIRLEAEFTVIDKN